MAAKIVKIIDCKKIVKWVREQVDIHRRADLSSWGTGAKNRKFARRKLR